MKNRLIKYLKFFVLFVTGGLLAGCSGLKVMIETEQPEDDFVVECVWSSKNFKIHGGKYEVKRNTFVASSGEVVDCGTSFWGVGPYTQISHPLYIYDKDYEKNIYDSKGKIKDIVSVYKMKLKEKYLDELIKNLKRKNLARVTINRLSGGFSGSYLSKYESVKKIKPGYFRKKYEKKMTKYWNKLLPIIVDELIKRGLEGYTAEEAINNYWKRVKEYEYESDEKFEDE